MSVWSQTIQYNGPKFLRQWEDGLLVDEKIQSEVKWVTVGSQLQAKVPSAMLQLIGNAALEGF